MDLVFDGIALNEPMDDRVSGLIDEMRRMTSDSHKEADEIERDFCRIGSAELQSRSLAVSERLTRRVLLVYQRASLLILDGSLKPNDLLITKAVAEVAQKRLAQCMSAGVTVSRGLHVFA